MPKLKKSLPKYRRHKASGQAVVTLNGRDFYLGPWGTRASRLEYDKLVAEWMSADRQLPVTEPLWQRLLLPQLYHTGSVLPGGRSHRSVG